jgi:DNA invertase Pin-like site-specific DNA recombinase
VTARRRKQAAVADPSSVVAYVRVSTEEQALSGLGLSAQRSAIEAAAAAQGLVIVSWHADEGLSAKTTDRPGLQAALAECSAGRAGGVVVAKLDRLSRSLRDVLMLVDRAQAEGWRLVMLDVAVDTGTTQGRFVLSMLGSVAELERGLIADRTRSALAVRKEQGVRLGRPVVVPQWVRERIAAERAAGVTLRGIAARLNDQQVPTARGRGGWQAETVAGVIRSIQLDKGAMT